MASIYDRIEPERRYRIGEAAKLAGVSTVTLRKDARQGYIQFTVSEKGRMKFLGKQLIHHINNVI